jgi:surfeit locus 1 family protein
VLTLLAPRFWGGHLLMVFCTAAAVALGFWQYGAWSHHRDDAARSLANVAAVPLSSLMGGDSPFPGKSLGQPVTFTGSWLPAGTVYVADSFLDNRNGYWVVTPVLIGKSAMPVVRGWSAKPTAAVPAGTVKVTGWLQASQGDDTIDTNTHDDVIPSMRVASLVERIRTDLYSGYVVARDVVSTSSTTATGTEGLKKVTPSSIPAPSEFTGLRNILYAVQWWVFAGFAVFIWVRWCRDTLDPTRASDSATGEDATNEVDA